MSDTPAIVVDEVSKRFRVYRERPSSLKERFTRLSRDRFEEFWAVNDVSFEVAPGTVYGLIGHNGSGKSSLLRVMAGIHRPTKGRVVTNGRISALLELGAGFHPDLSGRENVYLNASILGLRRKEVDGLFDAIVEFSGLHDFIDTPVKHYSSGMYVRLGFAVAVHVNPQILIVDEVIAVGDEEFQRRCFEHLYKLRNRGVTIVMVSHSLGLVQSMCDRVAWLDHGALMAEGKSADVVYQYLSQVNEREAERIEQEDAERQTAGEIDVEASGRPISIDSVEFLDGDGGAVAVGRTSTPLTVRIHYQVREPVRSPLFSFAVENEHGQHMATPGMRAAHQDGSWLTGDGYVDYSIPALSLAPGEYVLSLAAHDTNGLVRFDFHDRSARLKVQPGDDMTVGLVDLLGQWQRPTGPRREDK